MMFEEIGYFSKTQGLKGQLQLNIIQDFDIESCNALFVQLNTGQSPQFIQDFRETKNGFIITLDDVNTIELAKMFVGKKVLIDAKYLTVSEEISLVGYILSDEKHGEIGAIKSIEEAGANLIFTIQNGDKEVLLPYIEDLVLRIDDAKKIVFYKAPEGLIDMYLE